jgi:hypothetical protein
MHPIYLIPNCNLSVHHISGLYNDVKGLSGSTACRAKHKPQLSHAACLPVDYRHLYRNRHIANISTGHFKVILHKKILHIPLCYKSINQVILSAVKMTCKQCIFFFQNGCNIFHPAYFFKSDLILLFHGQSCPYLVKMFYTFHCFIIAVWR